MNLAYYESLLDKNGKEGMERWDLQKLKQTHPTFLLVIYKTIDEANIEYKKLVAEMRKAQKDYFACRDTSKKKALQNRAMDLERRVDQFKVDLPPVPLTVQKPLFD